MNIDMIHQFCQSPRRWLIISGVTFLVALAVLLPQVDLYRELAQQRRELELDLAEARRVAAELPRCEDLLKSKTVELGKFEKRMAPAEEVGALRDEILEAVRKTGCQVLKLSVGNVQRRPWMVGDRPSPTPLIVPGKVAPSPTPFELETRAVSITVSGSSTQVRTLLGEIEKQDRIHHANSVEMRPAGSNRKSVELSLELWYFALERPIKA